LEISIERGGKEMVFKVVVVLILIGGFMLLLAKKPSESQPKVPSTNDDPLDL
jgi:hypothetical protein